MAVNDQFEHWQWRFTSIFWILALTTATADIEKNPGPRKPKYPCGTCGRAVTWKQKGIRCDNSNCQQWYHIDCQNMRSTIYEFMDSSNCSWECLACAFPNFSTTLFDLHSLSSTNGFSVLSDADKTGSHSSPGPPIACSSPVPTRGKGNHQQVSTRPLRILNVNCQSIMNKREEFDVLLSSANCDVIFGTESWLNGGIKDNEVFPPGYSIYRKDRSHGRGGGVFIGVRENIMSSRVQDYETDCEIVWVKLDITKHRSLYLAAFYRPSANDQLSLDHLTDSLARLPKNQDIWLAGDMNLPGIDWTTNDIKPSCPTPTQHNQFMEILADNGLTQTVETPTRGDNILDLFAVSNPTLVNRIETMPGISDHDVVFAEIDVSPKRYQQQRRQIPIYTKAKWDKIKDDLKVTHIKLQKEKDKKDVNSLWNILKTDLLHSIKQHIPHKTTSKKDRPPWIKGKVRSMIRARHRIHKKIKTTKENTQLMEMERKMRDLKHNIRRETRKAYWDYVESIMVPNDEKPYNKDSKKLYSFIKHRKSDSIGIAPLKDRGQLKELPRDKAEILNEQFKSVFTDERPLDNDILNMQQRHPDIDQLSITAPGIQKLLEQLQPHKAMGPDQLHPRVMKEVATNLAPPLQTIFMKSLISGEVPADWRKAHVVPIFKKGEKYLASNYPTSLAYMYSIKGNGTYNSQTYPQPSRCAQNTYRQPTRI